MRWNSKWTWGLAWAGLAVVVAVPSLDFFTGRSAKTAAVLSSTTDLGKTASVTTTVTPNGITITPAGASADPVSGYLKTNKALPDYVSGGSGTGSDAPTRVANIDPITPVVAPVPFPARPADTIAPPVASPPAPAITTTANLASSSVPYVIDEPAAPVREANVTQPAGPIPPADIVDDTNQWHTQSLEKYLDQNGLMDDSTKSTANLTVVDQSDPSYDPNGFYLSDGPNSTKAERRRRMLDLLSDDGDTTDFTLF